MHAYYLFTYISSCSRLGVNWKKTMMAKKLALFCCCWLCSMLVWCQETIVGVVKDATSGAAVPFANVILKANGNAAQTDFDGNFTLQVAEFPATLMITCVGYTDQNVNVPAPTSSLLIRLAPNSQVLSEAEVVGSRVSEKQRQAALTVESMDVLAIKEAPTGSFYEGLGNLKGVDLTSASLGFKIINTRGFNSTSPVRSLQLIDGVDNQSPGLNFSLGNFLGSSDLDVKRVEIVAGASSAFYGPGAFNGVVNMETKDPFLFPGFSMSLKKGERALYERAIRYAKVIQDKNGEDRFGFKVNFFSLEAREWEAEDYGAIFDSPHNETNPFGFDAVNIYGDEPVASNNDVTDDPFNKTGLGVFYRPGYREIDLVNYNTENRKFNTGLYYKFNPTLMLNYNFAYSTGNTIYQGDNRYALRGVQFFQHKLELSDDDKWFLRLYSTNEDAGQTYDVVTTGIRMLDANGSTQDWNTRLSNTWGANFVDQVQDQPRYNEILQEVIDSGLEPDQQLILFGDMLQEWYVEDYAYFNDLYQQAVDITNSEDGSDFDPFYEPGTARFDSLLTDVTTRTFTEGGSLFYDKSALYHAQGEYKLDTEVGNITMGFSGRLYRPDTRGTIFADTLQYTYAVNDLGEQIAVDSSYVDIRNREWGVYAGWDQDFREETLKANVTVRVDKNQNFDYLVSPAASLVWLPDEKTTVRFTFSSAVRNPTLADQYLYYNVGRAILLGNIDGRFEQGSDSLFTIDSFTEYRNSESLSTGLSKLEWYNLDKIRPERVRTIEAGYRSTWWDNTYVDASFYYSIYRDFIGYNIGLSSRFDPLTGLPTQAIQAFRVASNAQERVTTTGFSVGANYFFKRYTVSGNYSWNRLISGEDDPIIPAFNTPEHKFNLGFSGRDLSLWGKIPNVGFGINYKWVQGFLFEGSPQFTGNVPTYDMVDASINIGVDKLNCTFKLGGSNILGIRPFFDSSIEGFAAKRERAFNNRNLQVYGGPLVGRLLYASILFEIQ